MPPDYVYAFVQNGKPLVVGTDELVVVARATSAMQPNAPGIEFHRWDNNTVISGNRTYLPLPDPFARYSVDGRRTIAGGQEMPAGELGVGDWFLEWGCPGTVYLAIDFEDKDGLRLLIGRNRATGERVPFRPSTPTVRIPKP